ncbi:hypothetical protein ABZ488_36565 [Streptomyces griseus]|uniref:hypothetical protein n=1 Tax=Streptomyces griseus TaxID=1911 RepID=UPI003401915C
MLSYSVRRENILKEYAKPAARWAIPTVVLLQVLLVWSGVLTVGQAVVVGLTLEVLLVGVVLAEIALARRAYRTSRAKGSDGQQAIEEALRAILPGPVAKAVGMELGLMRSTWRWIRRRPDVAPGQQPMSYGGEIRPIMWVMIFLTPLEIVAIELLLPWATARIVLLILAIYGTVWVLGFLGALTSRPHVLGDGHLTLRFVHFTSISVPLGGEVSATMARHSGYKKSVNIKDGILAMPIGDSTNMVVKLSNSVLVRPKPDAPEQEIREVRFSADDPRSALKIIQTHNAKVAGEG